MLHQDWTTISIKNPTKQKVEKTIVSKKGDTSIIDQKIKIENDTENYSFEKIPILLSKEIIDVRVKLKLTQKDVAIKLNTQLNLYTELENGKAVYSNETKQLINKLERVLRIKFENKHITPFLILNARFIR
jgi:ribosome-binding protein aMBF1 (putative translation factor)